MLTPLISAEDLNKLLGTPNVKIFDVRGIWGTDPRGLEDAYNTEHLPHAVFLDWRRHFIEQNVAPSLAQVADYEAVKASFKALGISLGDTVILYDDHYHMFAGRIWWAMRYWGFTNVRVLNGGLTHWKAQNLPLTQNIPTIEAGSFEPVCQEHLRIALDDFMVEKIHTHVFDGRGSVGYNGKPEDPRTGHIPGAISASYNAFVDPETRLFYPPEKLEQLLNERVANWRTEKIISSCGAGYSGTVPLLALAMFGIESSLFDESFSVWKLDPNRPVEQSC